MNKKKMFLKICFSLIFLFVFGYSFIDVNAEEASCACAPGDYLVSKTVKDDGSVECNCQGLGTNRACQPYFDSSGANLSAVYDKYKPIMTDLRNGSWQISINPDDPNDSSVLQRLRNVRFKLYSINDVLVTYDAFLSYDYPVVVNTVTDSNGYMNLLFQIDKEHPDPDCFSEDFWLEVQIMDGGDARFEDPELTIPENPYGSGHATSRSVDCNNQRDAFDRAFCTAKDGAKANDPSKTLNINFEGKFNNERKFSDFVGANNYTKFSCKSSSIYVKEDDSTDYYMSANTSYMYGSGERVIDAGNYNYNFWCGRTKTSDVSCKIKCEEAVTIEYGAPIASKAGLCFEYKVKVTSHVSCTMVQAPAQPRTYSVCTPSPTCTGIGRNGNRYYLTQGGPNEEFDRCVEKCDGGKYTSKCSKQCYKEVYQKTLISYTPKKNAFNNCSCSHCYTTPDTWSGGGPGRWYGGSCNPEYVPDDNGFCRHDYGGGRICQDTCWWDGCDGDNYLNSEAREQDYEDNWEIYYEAVNKCEAAASCSTSKAEFTISVNYKDGSNVVKTIDFPYSTNALVPDYAQYEGSNRSISSIGANNTTLIGLDGCYNRPADNSVDFYATEWGFPGSWINRKTGELSYKNKSATGTNGWQFIPDKFCVPFDAQDVNVNWWNYYYTKLHQSNSTKYLAPKCVQNSLPTVEVNNNIIAKAKNFGYYGWNIEVDCFYALNNTEKLPCDPPEAGDPNDDIKYVIRSIDLEDVFPNVTGEQLVTPESEVGREPGFNWSSQAYNEKNLNYVSAPLDYALRIQELGYSIYSDDDQLDYKFRLSPAVLNELKRQRSSDYTLYEGDNYTDDKGVIRYRSRMDILDDSSITLKKPNASALQCNNMISRNACEAHARH